MSSLLIESSEKRRVYSIFNLFSSIKLNLNHVTLTTLSDYACTVWCLTRLEEVEFLRDRALRMLDAAKDHIKKGYYDLAAFMAEQAAQLFTKTKILEDTGEMPRTHVIRRLFAILIDLYPQMKEVIENFVREKRSLFIRLEEAYLATRYFFRKYDKEEAEDLISFSEEVINFVRNIRSRIQDEEVY